MRFQQSGGNGSDELMRLSEGDDKNQFYVKELTSNTSEYMTDRMTMV
jgi:hypothetical protein